MYSFQEFSISDHMMDAIDRYIQHGIAPGGFLTAVITNDLAEAVGRADQHNMRNLPAYVAYFYNEAPADCWGSPDRMRAYMKRKVEEATHA